MGSSWPVLREKLGEDGAAALADVLQTQEDHVLTAATDRFERRLGEECDKLRVEMAGLRSDMKSLGADMRADCAALRGEFRAEIGNTRAELLKWSFVFWVGQVAAITALVLTLR